MKKEQLINNLLDIKDRLCKLNYNKSIHEVINLIYENNEEDFINSKIEDIEYRLENLDWIEDYIINLIKEDWIVNTLHYYKDCNFEYDDFFRIDEYWYVENIDESDVESRIDDIIDELQNQ